jgi:glycosyltransferase involved in cell wall biosynthesis
MLALRALGRCSSRLIAVPQVSLVAGQSVGPETLWRRALERADWIVAPVPGVLAEILAVDPALGEKASIIPDAHEREPARIDPIPWNPPHLVALGRLDPIKGLDVALDAFARLAPRYPGLRFTIAGQGPARASLEARGRDLGVSDRVTFTGYVTDDQADALRQSASIMVMPSRLEGFGIAALEVARAGRPLIASDIVALRDVVAREESGLLVPPGDPSSLAEAMARLLDDHGLAERLGARARVRAAERFGWAATIDAYDGLVHRFAQ